jgi:hypothetical protein
MEFCFIKITAGDFLVLYADTKFYQTKQVHPPHGILGFISYQYPGHDS